MTHIFYYFGEDRDLMERVLGVKRSKINYWVNRGYIPVYDAMDIKRAIPDYPKTLKQICPYVYQDDWPEYEYRYEYHLQELEKERAAAEQDAVDTSSQADRDAKSWDDLIYLEGGGTRLELKRR